MVKGFKVDYATQHFSIGGGGPDKHFGIPSTAVYLPEELLFIKRDASSDILSSPDLSQIYKVLLGEGAKTEYRNLLKELKKVKPEKIEVSEAFVEWVMAVYKAKNPPKEAHKLLDK